ncbi:MAG: hypothetical protein R3266_00755 [Gemmatimonadota bacterium]|nr:hypothetical protein [Gemmatimonadota bacterium]
MTRAALGWLVLVIWTCVLGWNAQREFFRPDAERLALGAATLPPGAAYYAVETGDRPAGMVTVQIDTLPARRGFHVSERLEIRLPGLGPAGEIEVDTDSWLGPGVTLDSLERRTVRGADTIRVRARVGDGRLRWEGPSDTIVFELPADAVVQTETSWPLRYAAAGGARVDEVRRITLLDAAAGAVRELDLTTREIGRRVFADSADTDPETGEWIAAGRDTVSAWRVEVRPAAIGRSPNEAMAGPDGTAAWVDEDGRYVETELSGGLRMRRTAFELAFFRETP